MPNTALSPELIVKKEEYGLTYEIFMQKIMMALKRRRLLPAKKLISIKAQRNEEILCVFQEENTGCKQTDWYSENEIEIEDIKNCVDRRNDTCETDYSIPVIESMEEWLTNPWSID
ncbi:hypothetical protein FQA39_LY12398 [Lamprigera yunnana]|nr:hypothetical protein FQA39_LY12398 [Lamprigera yunnana]